MQTPLPDQIDEARVMLAIDPMKDVDGLHPFSAGQLYLGRPTFVPATPLGVMHLLAEYKIPIAGPRAVVVGRSSLVGKPMAMLLLQANATVTICHSRTEDLARHTLDADILVAAVGLPGVITADMVKQGATVDRRRHHANRRWARGRCRGGRRRSGRIPHAGPRRRRPDDHRVPCSATRCGLLATAAGSLRSRASELHSAPLYQ